MALCLHDVGCRQPVTDMAETMSDQHISVFYKVNAWIDAFKSALSSMHFPAPLPVWQALRASPGMPLYLQKHLFFMISESADVTMILTYSSPLLLCLCVKMFILIHNYIP